MLPVLTFFAVVSSVRVSLALAALAAILALAVVVTQIAVLAHARRARADELVFNLGAVDSPASFARAVETCRQYTQHKCLRKK